MKTDRELLELAAKAAGIQWKAEVVDADGYTIGLKIKYGPVDKKGFSVLGYTWNPLEDDGDALRLAVKLGISVWVDGDIVWCDGVASVVGPDSRSAATAARRAIVRAAAAMGEGK